MFQQVIARSFLWLIPLFAVLIVGIIACGGDEDDDTDGHGHENGHENGDVNANDWVGTWKIETVDGEDYEQVFVENLEEEFGEGVKVSIVANRYTFNNDGTLESEFKFKTTGKIGDEDVSGTLSLKGTGTYALSGSNYTITATQREEGTGWFEGEQETWTEDESGTWSREGNSLTMNSDQDAVVVLKKQ